MRFLAAVLLTVSLAFAQAGAAQDRKATTDDGRTVILKANGTWSFLPDAPVASDKGAHPLAGEPRFTKGPKATQKIQAPHGQFAIWIDPHLWRQGKSEGGKVMLETKDGKGYAMILADSIPLPKNSLKDVALRNAQNFDANASVVSEEKRIVNGREVLCLQFQAKYESIPFRYYGYYYGGTSGSVQVVAFTADSVFDSVKGELTDLLNGLEMADDPIPDASRFETIAVNDGRIKISYDREEWNNPKREGDKTTLSYRKGAAWAMIIPEKLAIPMDSLLEAALTNAKKVDPDAKTIYREKRTVHGQEIWCLKITATVNSLPFVYYGYYYSGAAGTVQVLTYTTAQNLRELEPKLTELLNSLDVDGALRIEPRRQ